MLSNPQPQNILHRKVTVGTTTNNTVINEGHRIFGPYAPGVNSVTLPTGNKKVVPLTENTGEGSHFLKITFPQTQSTTPVLNSTLYITFCKKNSQFTDGYQDYQNSVPQSFIDDLKSWIDNGRPPLQGSSIRFRKLTFTTYGRETAQKNNSLTFEVRFSYTGIQIPQAPPQAPGGGLQQAPSPNQTGGGTTGGVNTGVQQFNEPR